MKQIGNTIALRDSATMQKQSDQIHTLTKKTVEDTMAMKILTVIAVVYLPASFTAVCLSTVPSLLPPPVWLTCKIDFLQYGIC